jgi:catechol 2,3-dioxygenase-like lactoylglutathione lyase family enzyme
VPQERKMIDHLGIPVSDIARSRAFYEAALGALGMSVQMEVGPDKTGDGSTALGFGIPGEKIFWIGDGDKVGSGVHVAFQAERREHVDQVHAAGLNAGGRDNGAPGPRPNYGPDYYAAFVYDPDGANIEAVCYTKE